MLASVDAGVAASRRADASRIVTSVIRPLDPATDADACDAIVRGLPDWFGMEEGIEQARTAVRSHDGLVAVDENDDLVGFLTWSRPRPASAEITWMAVRADRRRHGHGRALIEGLTERLVAEGTGLVFVKTLSDTEPYEPYAETRRFYDSMGFQPALDLDLWGPQNPALLYVRVL
jgi:GNAT superfamily N-acetyltransferase